MNKTKKIRMLEQRQKFLLKTYIASGTEFENSTKDQWYLVEYANGRSTNFFENQSLKEEKKENVSNDNKIDKNMCFEFRVCCSTTAQTHEPPLLKINRDH